MNDFTGFRNRPNQFSNINMNSSFYKARTICATHVSEQVSSCNVDTPRIPATFYNEWPDDESKDWARRVHRRRRRRVRRRIEKRWRRALTSSRRGKYTDYCYTKVQSSNRFYLKYFNGRELGLDEDEFTLAAQSYEVRERLERITREQADYYKSLSDTDSTYVNRWDEAYAGIDDPAFVPRRQRSLSDPQPEAEVPKDIFVGPESPYHVETVDEEDCLSEGLEPHGFFDTISEIKESAESLKRINAQVEAFKTAIAYKATDNDSIIQNAVSRIEDLAALILTLSGVSSIGAFTGAIFLYLRTHYKGSFLLEISKLVSDALAVLIEPKSIRDNDDDTAYDDIQPHSDESPLESIKLMLHDWKVGRNSSFAKHMGNLVCILVTCGFTPELALDPSTKKKFKLFSPSAWSIQDRPLDFLEMVAETAIFFVERGIKAFTSNDWTAVFCDDNDLRKMDKLYAFFVGQVPLLEAGKLGSLLGNEELGITCEYDFQLQLERLINTFGDFLVVEKNPVARGALTSKLVALTKVRSTLVAAQRSSPVRQKPFGVVVFGGSAIAKTNLSDVLIKVILSANGFPSGKQHITTMNDLDKFMSDYKTEHTCITLDDFANAVAQTYEGSPLAKIIDILNNVPKAALKADVESKGNVMIQPKLVMVTTNVKRLLAHTFSNCPGAILRRFNYHLTARLKPNYIDPETGGFDPSKAVDDLIPDYWYITVQHVLLQRGETPELDGYKFETDMEDADIYKVIDFMVEKSRIHFGQQERFVAHVEKLFDSTLCEHARDPRHCPKCDAEELKRKLTCPSCHVFDCVCANQEPLPEFGPMPLEIPYEDEKEKKQAEYLEMLARHSRGEISADSLRAYLDSLPPDSDDEEESECASMPGMESGCCDSDDSSLESTSPPPLPPENWEDDDSSFESLEPHTDEIKYWREKTNAMYAWGWKARQDKLRNEIQSRMQRCLMMAKEERLRQEMQDDIMALDSPGPTLEEATEEWFVIRQLEGAIYDAKQACLSLVDVFHQHRQKIIEVTLAGSATLALVYGALKLYSAIRGVAKSLEDQGSTMQKPEPYSERQSEWLKPTFAHVPLQNASISTTSDRLLDNIGRRIAHLTVSSEGRTDARANIVPLWKNEWLMPGHMIRNGVFKVRIRTTPVDSAGLNFSEIVDESCWTKIPGTDFAIIRLMKGGSNRDFVKFLPDGDFKGVNGMKAHSVLRDESGENQFSFFPLLNKNSFTVAGVTYDGIAYNCPFPTFKGQCMMAAIVDSKQPFICGFHIAGKSGTSYGVLGTLSRKQVEEASARLKESHPLVMHSDAHFNPSRYGVEVPVEPTSDPRHPINFMCVEDGEEPNLVIHGQHGGGVARFSSNVRTSVISDAVEEAGIPRVHGPPDHKNYNKHYQRELHQLAHSKGDIPPALVLKALDDFSGKILEHLEEHPELKEMVHPMPNDYNLAGCDGIAYVDRVDLTTSAGFPLNKAKKTFIFPSDREVEGITEPLDVEEINLWETVDQMEEMLANGERIHAIHRANLKDEPVKFGKDKIRVFAGCEVAFTLLYRRHLLGFNRLVQKCPTIFETAVGINASGKEWDGFVKYISTFGENNVIDGDFKSFDKRMPPLISRATFEVAIRVCKACGYTDRQIAILEGIATEVCYPTYEYKGVFVTVHGGMPSGYPGTALQNGFATCLYIRLPFFRDIFPDGDQRFHDYAKVGAYGDDHTVGVKDGCPLTMNLINDVLGSFGIQYTAADKTAISRDYDSLCQASFLKRGMRFDEDTQTYLAPLEEASIAKSLHNYMHRKNVPTTKEQIAADALVNALREYFQHGREKYNSFRNKIPMIAEKSGIMKYVPELDTYEEALARYNGEAEVDIPSFPDDSELECQMDDGEEGFDFPGFDFEFDPFYDGEYFPPRRVPPEHGRPLQDTIFELDDPALLLEDLTSLKEIFGDTIFGPKYDGYQHKWGVLGAYVVLCATVCCIHSYSYSLAGHWVPPHIGNEYTRHVLAESLIHVFLAVDRFNGIENSRLPNNKKESQGRLQTRAQPSTTGCSSTPLESARLDEDKPRFVSHPRLPSVFEFQPLKDELEPHMDFVKEHGYCVKPPSNLSQEQNTMFADANPAVMSCIESEYDQVRRSVDNDDATLADFFSRPVKIWEVSWQYGIDLHQQVNPWSLYFSNKRVANRISNFLQMRCKLHVKFVVNGSPFYYGRVMVSYLPLHQADQFTLSRPNQDLISASQRPHVFLDPTASQGAEMVLPFVWHANNLSLPAGQFQDMGVLVFDTLSILKHTSGAGQALNIQIFAWAEDVHLSIPTSRESYGLVPQADDEYGNGPVSKKASVLARVAGALTSSPWIGQYARATQIGASAVSSIASTFGYSKPIIVADPTRMVPFYGNLALTTGGDTSNKLTLDPKQELSIDPRMVGLGGTDEMTIRSIATRESYLNTFSWSPTASTDTLLWNCAVTPALWHEDGSEIHMTPMCFACLPFKYWRGNIRFRFMFASSSFHRGRFRIVYEPDNLESVEWNINYNTVVDLAETKDFTISVGWGQTQAIMNHPNPIDDAGAQLYGTTTIPGSAGDDRNGVLSVYVVNSLTNPDPIVNNDIKVHVFVSADDNFEVFNPDDTTIARLSWFSDLAPGFAGALEPQAEEKALEDATTPVQPEMAQVLSVMAPKTDDTDNLLSVHIGEQISSFRNCLKRYNFSRSIPLIPLAGTASLYVGNQVASNFPHYGGYVPTGMNIHKSSTGVPFNYTKMTLMNYLTPAYVCRRGGIRWKYQYLGNTSYHEIFQCSRIANDSSAIVDAYTNVVFPPRGVAASDTYQTSGGAFWRAYLYSTMWSGANLAHRAVNNLLEVELPYMSNNRYTPGKRADMRTSIIDKARDNYYHNIIASVSSSSSTTPIPFLDGYVAAAEDFSLFFFTGPPVAYALPPSQYPVPQGQTA